MGWLGKAIGGSLGFMVGGPFGAIFGAVLGHQFDKTQTYSPFDGQQQRQSFTDQEKNQAVFFVSTFSLLAKLARADGKVTREEINVIDDYIKNYLNFDNDARDMAVKIFNVAKDSNETFDAFAQQFYGLFRNDRQMLYSMLELLVRVAKADGSIHPSEEQMLQRAAIIFNIGTTEYERIKGMHVQDNNKYYAILGATPNDTDDEIKKKYRQLVKEYHPDAVIAKGMPEEFIKFATEKFKEIQEAYDNVMKERKAA